MKTIFCFTLMLLLSGLFIGCQPSTPKVIKSAPITATLLPSSSLTMMPTYSSTSTASLQPTFTTTPTILAPTLAPLPLRTFEQRCAVMENSLPSGFLTTGMIILKWEYEWLRYSLMALSAGNDQPHPLSDLPEIGSGGKVSPDGKLLTYIASSDIYLDLIILSPDGTIQENRNRKADWGNPQVWLDTERIAFQSLSNTTTTLYLYNPFTDQEEIFSPEIKDRYEYDRELSGWPVWKLVPDPTLTRLVYVRGYGKEEKQYRPALVLINLENDQTLWELKRFSPGERHMPAWSPDGNQVAVLSDDSYRWEIFTISRNGQATQWINIMAQTYVHSSLEGEGLKWSPNGRYMAFFSESLYVLDMIEHQVIDLCIPTGEWGSPPQNVLLWSPDSRQILFQRDNAPTLVIDMESNRAAPLVEDINIRAMGWLASP